MQKTAWLEYLLSKKKSNVLFVSSMCINVYKYNFSLSEGNKIRH